MKVKIAKDITKYKEKVVLGFSLRQIISLVLAVGINVPIYFFLKPKLGEDNTGWIVMFLSVPIMMFGWFEPQGLTFEKYIAAVVWSFITPPVRPYKSEDELEVALNDIQEK